MASVTRQSLRVPLGGCGANACSPQPLLLQGTQALEPAAEEPLCAPMTALTPGSSGLPPCSSAAARSGSSTLLNTAAVSHSPTPTSRTQNCAAPSRPGAAGPPAPSGAERRTCSALQVRHLLIASNWPPSAAPAGDVQTSPALRTSRSGSSSVTMRADALLDRSCASHRCGPPAAVVSPAAKTPAADGACSAPSHDAATSVAARRVCHSSAAAQTTPWSQELSAWRIGAAAAEMAQRLTSERAASML
mmetsp:Transcript_9738/g.37896  ORF Transcript_9738/g.37896 Transcript_9738/m.37896 type:complete len:247 (+) Transcript_9738:2568-3308(+)